MIQHRDFHVCQIITEPRGMEVRSTIYNDTALLPWSRTRNCCCYWYPCDPHRATHTHEAGGWNRRQGIPALGESNMLEMICKSVLLVKCNGLCPSPFWLSHGGIKNTVLIMPRSPALCESLKRRFWASILSNTRVISEKSGNIWCQQIASWTNKVCDEYVKMLQHRCHFQWEIQTSCPLLRRQMPYYIFKPGKTIL